jgi:predicted nuclease with TOPRIM domain
MTYVDKLIRSGMKTYCHLTADSYEDLKRMAERLKVKIKESYKDKEPHLDLTKHQRDLAIRYGATEI